jgi:hypothetical protein
LDVGLDTTGEPAAAGSDAPAVLQPLPGAPTPPPQAGAAEATGQAAPATAGPPAACWRYSAGQWSKLGDELTLDACVQALFSGHCEAPGAADYGRWASNTLRLVVGRVELSADNRNFRSLVKQPPGDCSIPHVTE